MDLLKIARDAIRTAREDLKNDPDVRAKGVQRTDGLHQDLKCCEDYLNDIEEALKRLGYGGGK